MDIANVLDIFISILLGLIIGYAICRYLYRQPLTYHGPVADEIKKKVFLDKETMKCYQFIPVIHICPPSMTPKKK